MIKPCPPSMFLAKSCGRVHVVLRMSHSNSAAVVCTNKYTFSCIRYPQRAGLKCLMFIYPI